MVRLLNKRMLAVMALLYCVCTLSHHVMAQRPAAKTPPNIVIFIADDLDVNDIGAYGGSVARTPNIDRLSGESLRFLRAFAGSPTCGPARSTIFTGLLPFRHGAHGNHSGSKANTRSLVQYLQPLGYRVAIAGKLHVGPESVFPFERISGTNVPEPGFEKHPGLNWDLKMEPVDNWLAHRKKEPFLLIVADHSPHVVWPEVSTYDPDEIDVPEIHIDTEETRKSRARYYEDITKMDGNLGKLLISLKEHRLEDNTVVVFTTDQGPQWPFAKWTLYDDGIQVPMLVRWPGQIKPETQTGALVSHADLLPTFVEIAGGNPPDNIDGMSFLSVLQGQRDRHREFVFASHTGDGQMNRSPSRMVRTDRFKYILNLAPEIEYHTHMDKATDHDGGREYWSSWVEKAKSDSGAAKILDRYHHHPPEEFYDVVADPHETHNLSGDPAHQKILEELRQRLGEWRKLQGDFETGPEVIEIKPSQRKPPVAPYVFLD